MSGIEFILLIKAANEGSMEEKFAEDNDKYVYGIAGIADKGKEDFTKSVLNTEVIRKQRCTFASSKRMAQTAARAMLACYQRDARKVE